MTTDNIDNKNKNSSIDQQKEKDEMPSVEERAKARKEEKGE